MSQALVIYLADDSTLATALTFATPSGTPSGETELHAWFGKGETGGALADVWLQAEVWDGANWILTGHPALDEKWIRVRVGGSSNPGNDPAFSDQNSDPQWLGLGNVLRFDDFRGNTMRKVYVEIVPPLRPGVSSASFTFRLVARVGDVAFVLPAGVSDLGTGVITGIGCSQRKEWLEAYPVTAIGDGSGVVLLGSRWIWNGIAKAATYASPAINQTDGASASLSVGQEYTALLTRDATTGNPNVTKGIKAGAGLSVPPAAPAGELLYAKVIVPYSAGTGAIVDGGITTYASHGELLPYAGTGLNLSIGHGRAILAGGEVQFSQPQGVVLPDATTSYVWLSADGTFALTATEVPPVIGVEEIAKVVTAGGVITTITDKRRFYRPGSWIVPMFIPGNETLGTASAVTQVPVRGQVGLCYASVRTASVGNTGQTVADVFVVHNGSRTSIFGGANQPTIRAQDYVQVAGLSFVSAGTFEAGDFIEVDVIDVTVVGTTLAAGIGVGLVCWPA